MKHIPVMQGEILKYFETCNNGLIIDGTLGLGGHSEALLSIYPRINILGLILFVISYNYYIYPSISYNFIFLK